VATVSIIVIILKVLLWLLALVAGLVALAILLVLFAPVSFKGRGEGSLHPDDQERWDGWARWEADIRWGGVLLRLWLRGTHHGVEEQVMTVCGIRIPLKKASGKEQAEGKPKGPAKKRKRQRQRPTAGEIRAYIREGIRLARRLWASFRLRAAGDATFGFDDPALTGMTLGALGTVRLPRQLTLRPDWFTPGVTGWLSLRGHIYGFEVAVALWSAYWRSPLGRRLRRRFTFASGKRKMVQEVEYHGRAG